MKKSRSMDYSIPSLSAQYNNWVLKWCSLNWRVKGFCGHHFRCKGADRSFYFSFNIHTYSQSCLQMKTSKLTSNKTVLLKIANQFLFKKTWYFIFCLKFQSHILINILRIIYNWNLAWLIHVGFFPYTDCLAANLDRSVILVLENLYFN